MRFSLRWMAAAIALSGTIVGAPTIAFGEHKRFVYDDHGGRPGGTLKSIKFEAGDPRFRVEPSGKCGQPFLGGTAFGHADPRLTDPKAVCGHGVVLVVLDPDVGRRPLLILPVSTTPVAPEGGAVAAGTPVALDSTKLVREQLPRLDAVAGDAIPAVVELRRAIRARDVAKAMTNVPTPMPEQ
jgi:hypothetical protein